MAFTGEANQWVRLTFIVISNILPQTNRLSLYNLQLCVRSINGDRKAKRATRQVAKVLNILRFCQLSGKHLLSDKKLEADRKRAL